MKKKLKYIVCRHYLDSRQYVVKNIKEDFTEFIGSLSDCYSWIRLTKMGIKIKKEEV